MKTNYIKIAIFTLFWFLFIACNSDMDSGEKAYNPDNGKGGSTARFTINGDYLYSVNSQSLKTFDISTPEVPVETSETNIGWDIETIYSYNDYLFIGSSWGLYVYGTSNPQTPDYISDITHAFSCDPVVASGNFAYVTLHSESRCSQDKINELQVIDISDIKNLKLVGQYTMTSPKGLGIDDTLLFVCDAGVKIFDINNIESGVPELDLIGQANIEATDLIPLKDLLIVTGDNGINQYSYANGDLKFLSSLYSSKSTSK